MSEHEVDETGHDAVSTLRRSLVDLVAVAQQVRVADFEHEGAGPLDPLLRHAESTVARASEELLRIIEHFEELETRRRSTLPPIALSSLMASIDEAIEVDEGTERIVSIAFLGRIAIRERGAMLWNATGSDRWEIVDLAGSTLREISKVGVALDLAISEYMGWDVERTLFVSEVEHAIETRRAYRVLQLDVTGDDPPTHENIVARTRRAAASLAKLVGRPTYPHFRTRDRFEIRKMQGRIAEYLSLAARSAVDSDALARDGIRLHRDLTNLVELMMQVNHRVELRGYDATIASDVVDALARGESVGNAVSHLQNLLGRSPMLDAVLSDSVQPTRDELMRLLVEIISAIDADGRVRRSFVMPRRIRGAG